MSALYSPRLPLMAGDSGHGSGMTGRGPGYVPAHPLLRLRPALTQRTPENYLFGNAGDLNQYIAEGHGKPGGGPSLAYVHFGARRGGFY